MDELEVRIVRLEPLRVASTLGFGETPEIQAWERLLSWASSNGLLNQLSASRFFGFNNPNPSPGSPNYGYEQWMTVGPDAEPGEQVEIKDFSGGRFAVTRCNGIDKIEEAWKNLVAWVEDSAYKMTNNPCLEELLTPELMLSFSEQTDIQALVFDLYLPIADE